MKKNMLTSLENKPGLGGKDILAMTGYMATARFSSLHRKTSSFATCSREDHFKFYVKGNRK